MLRSRSNDDWYFQTRLFLPLYKKAAVDRLFPCFRHVNFTILKLFASQSSCVEFEPDDLLGFDSWKSEYTGVGRVFPFMLGWYCMV